MTERKWTIVYPSGRPLPVLWLSGIASFQCGTRFECEFSCVSSCALPLTREEAEKLLKIVKSDLGYAKLTYDKNSTASSRRALLQIVQVPWLEQNKEAADNE